MAGRDGAAGRAKARAYAPARPAAKTQRRAFADLIWCAAVSVALNYPGEWNVDAVNELMGPDFAERAYALIASFGTDLITAIVIFVVGRWVARWLARLTERAMEKADADSTLIGFVRSIVYIALLTFVVMAAIAQLGIQTTSFIAVLGAAGFAIGLALQGSLGNFAAGVMMIIFRPFKAGDFVEAAGISGVVEEIKIFTTTLRTGDNKTIIVPNSNITSSIIVNYSAKPTRRVDLTVGVSYGDNLDKVREVISGIIAADDRVLVDPGPTIAVSELADSSVNFAVRVWVNGSDYWPVFFDLNETIKKRFDEEGISIPFPQQDVHVHQVAASS
jgi:small conductance mechanosensitive channel